ncbi:MAG: bicyclomycin resistance protein, partial [Microbacteriaceae bacterium]|nr:bicyclomycin resistance protein [Microbacteriaceae bacterium]
EPASFGELVSWAMITGASEGTQGVIEYMISDAYLDWLALAPEGKVPTRLGNADDATAYIDGWQGLEAGVDTKALLSSVYGAETLATVAGAPDAFDRWGNPQGFGALAGAVGSQFILPALLAESINSGLSAADAAQRAFEQAETLKADLGL